MKKTHRSLWSLSIGIFVVLVLNIAFSYVVNGRIIYLQFLRSASKNDAEKNQMLIKENLQVIIEGDSIKKNIENFEIWRDKFVVRNQIGLLPISFKETDGQRAVIYIRPIEAKPSWFISFDGGKELLGFDYTKSRGVDINDTINIKFYSIQNGNKISLGNLTIIPEKSTNFD